MKGTLAWLIAGALAVAGHLTLTRSMLARQTTLKEEAARVEEAYRTAETKIRELPALRQRVREAEQRAAEAQRQFPAEENLGVLLARLQQAAQAQGLTVVSIMRTTQPSTLPGLTDVNLDVALNGRYPSLIRLLDWTQDERRVLTVTEIDSANSKEHRLHVTGYTRTPKSPQGAAP
ncbi:type 4a pilus biogenesis protein PilO [Deinococcus sp. YIM 77859]|uniref:type 4a pilus biogenesis protein PilO n=1 Tax=Deinococcus sp. YIM 77859 TaxID=1540221 RepID=UPI0005559927|nr:type 4a pilus biogenesis protein PilO [Deinococcus sp. YIM 77859]